MNGGLDECIVQGAKNITDMENVTNNLRARQTHQFYASKYNQAKETDEDYDKVKLWKFNFEIKKSKKISNYKK